MKAPATSATSPLRVNRSSSVLTSSPKCTADEKTPSEKELQASNLMLCISALRLDGTVSPHVHLPDARNELSSPSSTSTYQSFGLALTNEGVQTDTIHVSHPIQFGYNSSQETFRKHNRISRISSDRSVRAIWSSPDSARTFEAVGSSRSKLIAESHSSATSSDIEKCLSETTHTRILHSAVVSTSELTNGRDLEKELSITIHNSDGRSRERDGSHMPLTWGTASLKLSRDDLSSMVNSTTRHRPAAGDNREKGCSPCGLSTERTADIGREYDLPVTILPRWTAKPTPVPFSSSRTSNTACSFGSDSSGSGIASGSSVTALIGISRARLFSTPKKQDDVDTRNNLSLRVRVEIFPLNMTEYESPVSRDETTFVGSYIGGEQSEREYVGLKYDDGNSSCALRGIDKIKTSNTLRPRRKEDDAQLDGSVEDVAVGGSLCRSPAAWDALQFFLDHAINHCSEDLPLPQVGEYDEDALSFDSSIDTMDGLWMEEEWADLNDRSHFVLDQKYGENFDGGVKVLLLYDKNVKPP